MKHKKLLNIFISFLFSISIYYLFNDSNVISIFSFLFGVLSFSLLNKKTNKLPYIFSFIFTVIYILGYSLYYYLTYDYFFSDFKHILLLILSIVSFTIVGGNYLFFVFEKIKDINIFKKGNKPFSLLKVWISIIICWIPAYIAYYPGIYAYDIRMQSHELYFAQQFGHHYLSKYHPPLHTFIWGLCQKIAGITHLSTLTVYSTIQFLLVSLVVAYIIKFLYKQNVKKWILIVSYLFLVINPLMPIFALITTKDVYFSMTFAMVIIYLYEFVKDEEAFINNPKKYIPLLIFITLSCLFRNNAIYAFLVVSLLILFVYKKQLLKVSIIFICPLVLFYVINGPVYHLMGLSEGNKREILSVPIQQIGYVVKNHSDEINDYTLNNVNRFIKVDIIKEKYNLRFADMIKTSFNTDSYEKDRKSFWNLWYSLLKKYPKDYINAFLELDIPYWFIEASNIDPYANRVYLEDGIVYGDDAFRYEVPDGEFNYEKMEPSKWNTAYKFYHNFANNKYTSKIPLIKLVYSLSFPFVIMLFTAFILTYKKEYKKILVVLLPFMYLMTFLLGPVSNLRYIYPIMLLYPIFMFLIFDHNYNHKK